MEVALFSGQEQETTMRRNFSLGCWQTDQMHMLLVQTKLDLAPLTFGPHLPKNKASIDGDPVSREVINTFSHVLVIRIKRTAICKVVAIVSTLCVKNSPERPSKIICDRIRIFMSYSSCLLFICSHCFSSL